MNGWVPWKTLGWILFGRGFGPSHYIFLFYEEIQRLRQRLTEWCEPSHLIGSGREIRMSVREEQVREREADTERKKKTGQWNNLCDA